MMRVSFKTKRYIIDLYDEIKTIAPEYNVDPKLCMSFAMACTGFAYSKLQHYSLCSRRLSMTTFDRLYGNNIFMLDGLGTKGKHIVYDVAHNSAVILPAYHTRRDCIISFCSVIRRYFGNLLQEHTLADAMLLVWSVGYAENKYLFANIIESSNLLADVLGVSSFYVTRMSRFGIIVNRIYDAPKRRRLALCKKLIDASTEDSALVTMGVDHIFYVPYTASHILGKNT